MRHTVQDEYLDVPEVDTSLSPQSRIAGELQNTHFNAFILLHYAKTAPILYLIDMFSLTLFHDHQQANRTILSKPKVRLCVCVCVCVSV